MNVNQNNIVFIQKVVKTAQLVGIDNIIIEPEFVRAIDDNKSVLILHSTDVPEMEFGSIGINRTSVFTSRLDLVSNQPKFNVSATVDTSSKFARSLLMSASNIKVEYRCANPQTIQAPKQVNDVLKYKVSLNADAVALLQRAQLAMGADIVTIVGGEEGVSFELCDINDDTFSQVFTNTIEFLTDDTTPAFAHRYPIKVLQALFRHNPDGHFCIGQKGILSISVNGLTVYVLPRAN